MTERCKEALKAFHSKEFRFVLHALIRARQLDNKDDDNNTREYLKSIGDVNRLKQFDGGGGIIYDGAEIFDMAEWDSNHPTVDRVETQLGCMSRAMIDAVMIVMYAGRENLRNKTPYTKKRIDPEFREWWEYLNMDDEHFAANMIAEKRPLDQYLKSGEYMFRIDER